MNINAQLRAKRETLAALPNIPTLAAKRAALEKEIDVLSRALGDKRFLLEVLEDGVHVSAVQPNLGYYEACRLASESSAKKARVRGYLAASTPADSTAPVVYESSR